MFGRYVAMMLGVVAADIWTKQGLSLLWLAGLFTVVWLVCETADRMTRAKR